MPGRTGSLAAFFAQNPLLSFGVAAIFVRYGNFTVSGLFRAKYTQRGLKALFSAFVPHISEPLLGLAIPEENTLHYLSGKVIKLKDPQILKQFDALDKNKPAHESLFSPH